MPAATKPPDPHLFCEIGAPYDSKLCREGNNCMYMSVYLSFDKDVRKILADGHEDPTASFRACNWERDPGKNGEGEGYNTSHLIRYLQKLKSEGKIKSYKCVQVKRNLESPIDFLTLKTRGRKVGTRYLLFGNAPHSEWYSGGTSTSGNKVKSILPEFKDCQYQMKFGRHGKPVAIKSLEKLPIENVTVLKQENILYNYITSTTKWTKQLGYDHGSCIAYYPGGEGTSKQLWRQNNLVPAIFDNGKQVVRECTAVNLITTLYNIHRVYDISIEVFDSL